jgi:hypothetical protein
MLPLSEVPKKLPLPYNPKVRPCSKALKRLPCSQAPGILPRLNSSTMLPLSQTPAMLPLSETPAMLPLSNTPAMLPCPQTPGMLPLSFGVTRRGQPMLIYDGYEFYRQHDVSKPYRGGVTRWICTKSYNCDCKARLTTYNDELVGEDEPPRHSHDRPMLLKSSHRS